MRELHLKTLTRIKYPTNSQSIEQARAELTTAISNGNRVISGVSGVEYTMAIIISAFLFPLASEQKFWFEKEHVLHSDSCTFNSKRRLLETMLKDKQYLQKDAAKELDDFLRNLMSYRNSFAHGRYTFDGTNVILSYFEQKPQERVLNDECGRKLNSEFSGHLSI